jgi:anti-anti-sigma regulatory factor
MALLKITRAARGDGRSGLALEGRLTQASVALLRDSCREASGGAALLDLTGVVFVDPAGVRALLALERAGASLEGCSGLVHELLRKSRS